MDMKAGIKIIAECAKLYRDQLLDKQLLIVYGSDINHIDSMEIQFKDVHFLHLTGVQVSSRIPAKRFFKLALQSKLPQKELSLKEDGTSVMKLSVLKQTMSIHKLARMVGDYNYAKTYLYTEKLAGTTALSLGFVKDERELYVPNTILREDIRDITTRPQQRILAMYIKGEDENAYTQRTYLAPNVNPSKFPVEVLAKIADTAKK